MNIQTHTFLALFAIGSIGCSPSQKEEIAKVPTDALLGTWKLVSYVDHQKGGTSWGKYGNNVIYEKYITPTHFTWVRYEKDKDNLVGIGGGTYTFDGNTYTEDIQFFLSPGSSQLGQDIPFEVAFEDGLWEHVGFSKVLEFDADRGEMTVVDSLKIEEKWEKVEARVNTNDLSDILGTWELLSYRQEGDSLRSEYPGFVSYIKLITPTHFVWVRYNKEGDEVVGTGSGTFVYDGSRYIESISVMYPPGSNQVGTNIPFELTMKGGRWFHEGYIKRITDGQVTDSTLIDEIWSRIDNNTVASNF